MSDSIAILDFGSQYSQLIARRVRELHVYCELFPWNTSAEKVFALQPKGYILSGSPASVYDAGAPNIPAFVLESGLPLLGICYGMQALTHALGGEIVASSEREYGKAFIETVCQNPLLPPGSHQVWMSHGDRIETPPPGFNILAYSSNCPVAAIGDAAGRRFGLQFHPEVHHTPEGKEFMRRFVIDVCAVQPDWTPESIISQAVEQVRTRVGHQRVMSAVSGGVDSSVATALVHRALGDQLDAVFIDTGLLRKGERASVEQVFRRNLGVNLIVRDSSLDFLQALHGVTEPETKRRVIGEGFIRAFESEAKKLKMPPFLVQGTIYPDVVESSAPERAHAARIKTHHNVGGLPAEMDFRLIEPLRYLFKDEVRAVGQALGLPLEMVWRQPFPGPGLAVRCLGEITVERLDRLRAADQIFTDELTQAGMLQCCPGEDLHLVNQAFAVLLPVRTVGVMGDQRTYQEVVALRAVTTEDFMTADWAPLPYDLLGRVANRIVNEVEGVNRVVYDVTSKPPGTIEWE